MSIIGKYIFNMEFANVSKAYDEKEFIGTISKNVAQNNEHLIMFSDVISILTNEPNEELQALAFQYNQLREKNQHTFIKPNGSTVNYPVLSREEDVVAAIDMFAIALDHLNISEENKETMKNNYFQMLVFDLVTGQKDRNNNNYGLLYNEKTKELRFAPLFDNATIHMPGIPTNLCQINGYFIDNKQMMEVLLNHYSEYTSDFIGNIVENQDNYIKRSNEVAKRVLTPSEQKWVMPIITENLNSLSEVSKKSKRGSI